MFTSKTFQYFDQAHENKFTKDWFEEHENPYLESVKAPFEGLLNILELEFGQRLPVAGQKVSRPKRPKNRQLDKGIVKDFASVILSEPKPDRFYHPPCVHIQIGALPTDNFLAVGMYLENSKQLKKIRRHFDDEFLKLIESIESEWTSLRGIKYKRIPKDLDPTFEKLNIFKTFYFQEDFTRKQMQSEDFTSMIQDRIKLSLPFYERLNEILL